MSDPPVEKTSPEKTEGSSSGSFRVPLESDKLGDPDFKPCVAQITMERNAVFEDNFLDRRQSARAVIEYCFEDEMQNLVEGRPAVSEEPVVPIRFRRPPPSGPAHDVFGDAMNEIFQKLMMKGQCADFCHWMAYWLTKEQDDANDGFFGNIRYNPDVYVTEGTTETKKAFVDSMWPTAQRILLKSVRNSTILRTKWTGIHVSADQLKGQRPKQEDRFVAYPNSQYMNRTQDPVALLGVFDGHGGHECSQYAASHFWEAWLETRQTSDGDELQNQLKKSLELLDQRLTVRSVKEYWKGGTTAACCAIDKENKTMAFAWLGDSPGYVMNNMEFRKVTREHSPSDPEEARRVEEAGGQLFVIGGELRVNGVLNLTRALGDVPGRPMISNEPEICERPIEQGDYMVFLACDGVSDVLNTADLYNLVGEFVRTFPVEDYSEMARWFCHKSITAGSADNVTVVIGFLRPPQDIWNLMSRSSDDESDEEEEDEDDD
uniref:Uncharacterized protein fem-2 n=1 Tax=Caenorhabditis remanei TaxID=31234 RepID=Q8MNW9_CAERE|nr:putative protein phosphatase FEM-2 [Caenorhabditis remanei]